MTGKRCLPAADQPSPLYRRSSLTTGQTLTCHPPPRPQTSASALCSTACDHFGCRPLCAANLSLTEPCTLGPPSRETERAGLSAANLSLTEPCTQRSAPRQLGQLWKRPHDHLYSRAEAPQGAPALGTPQPGLAAHSPLTFPFSSEAPGLLAHLEVTVPRQPVTFAA